MNGQMANDRQGRQRWQRHDWLAAAALVALVSLFLARAFLPGKVLLPLDVLTHLWPPWQQPGPAAVVHNPLITDVINYIYPVKQFMAEQVKAGQLPLWNPYVLGGYPLTYNTQAGLWYPLSVLYYLLPPTTAVDLTIVLQMAFGGIFMYAYLRQISLRRAAALLGAIVFLFNGVMVVWLEWQVVHAAVVWLPLCLYFVERAAQKLEHREGVWAAGNSPAIVNDALLAGIFFAFPWLGGHWNWALYTSMTAAMYIVWRFAEIALKQRPGQRLPESDKTQPDVGKKQRKLLGLALLILVVGVGISLIQLLPAFVYISQGHRQPFTLAQSLSLGLKNRAVVALIPDFFGTPVKGGRWWGVDNYNETTFYLGILPLFLVTLAPFLRRDGITRFYTAWGALGWLWALGTPAYALLWLLPVFNGLPPSRAVIMVLFCAAVLSALALDKLLHTAVNWRLIGGVLSGATAVMIGGLLFYLWWYRPEMQLLRPELLWFGVALFAALALLSARTRMRPGLFALLAVLLVTVDLFWVGYDYNPIGDVADLYPETETARFLRNDPEPYRIATLLEGVVYWPNTNLQDRLPAIGGYEPAILQTWVDYMRAAEGDKVVHSQRLLLPRNALKSPLLDALNLKYVVTISDWPEGVALWTQLPDEEGSIRIYLNDGYFPRAYIVPQALVAADAERALALVVENQDRLHEVVVLEAAAAPTAAAAPEAAGASYAANGTGTAVITNYDLNRVSIHVHMNRPGYLVLADSYYPGWQATVDGEMTPLYRANSVVRAVYVPEGIHEVVFAFRPPDFYVGALFTAVTLLICIILFVWPRLYRRKAKLDF